MPGGKSDLGYVSDDGDAGRVQQAQDRDRQD